MVPGHLGISRWFPKPLTARILPACGVILLLLSGQLWAVLAMAGENDTGWIHPVDGTPPAGRTLTADGAQTADATIAANRTSRGGGTRSVDGILPVNVNAPTDPTSSLDATASLAPRFRNPARCAFGHHRLDVALDPATASLRVTDEILLLHPAGVPATYKVPFLLNRALEIRSVRASTPDAVVAVRWKERERWEPSDFWNRPEYPELGGMAHARQIDLHFKDPAASATWPESLLLVIAYKGTVYDSLKPPPENYQRGFETTTGLIDPRGAFLSSGTLWYPQRFDEPFSFRLTAQVPSDWETISQGRRTPPSSGPDGSSAGAVTWDSPEPMDEIYLIAGPYVLREEEYRGIAIQTFTYGDDDEALCRQYLDAAKGYLDLYTDLIGPYAFAKFAMVENFWQTGYGMPSFTLLGNRVVRLPWIVHTSYGHEILHNWWGNGVFVDWESGNWCEGLTVYGADYLYKEQKSLDAARDYRRTLLQAYLDYARAGRDFALTEFRSRHDASSAAVGYGKAMMIIHMLRRQLGDERFWGCLSEFYHNYLFKQASWTDLLGTFAAHSDKDFGKFYDEWIARVGAPLLTLAAADLTRNPDGQVDLTYTLEQSDPLYSLEVPVRVTFADRPSETWRAPLDKRSFHETRTLPEMPRTLEIDPDFDLFRRLHRAEVPAALSQLFGADSVTAIVCGQASAGSSEALTEAYSSEALTEAYRKIAEQSRRAKPTSLVSDRDVVLPDLRQGSVWIMGLPQWMDRLGEQFPTGVEIDTHAFRVGGQEYERSSHTLVLALPHPELPDEAIGLLLGSDPEAITPIWRKLPHYGKHSYLVFEGTTNVATGSWRIERSPLKVVWDEEGSVVQEKER